MSHAHKDGKKKAKKLNKGHPKKSYARHWGHPHHQPYAYQPGIRAKKFFTTRADYYPDANWSAPTVLSVVPSGNSDNQRLSDTVVFTHLEINAILQWNGNFTPTTNSTLDDCCVRMLVIASIDATTDDPPFIDAFDPLTCIDNSKVPSQCTILFDTGPKLLTPKQYLTGENFAINHLVHTVNIHKTLFPQGDKGVWSQFSGSTQNTGKIYAIFLSDAPDGTNRAKVTASFGLEFYDVVKGLASQVTSKVDDAISNQIMLLDRIQHLEAALEESKLKEKQEKEKEASLVKINKVNVKIPITKTLQ